MTNEMPGLWSDDDPEDTLARELRELRPTILRQQRAATVRPDPGFARALRARLTAPPDRVPFGERLRRVIATLVPPPAPRLALAGVRSAATGPQPRTYAAEDLQITVALAAAGESVALRGMLIGADGEDEEPAPRHVALLQGERTVADAEIDRFGAFILSGLSAGEYSLQLALPDRLVVVPSLEVSA